MWFDRYPCLESVIVNTRSGRAFRGVLWTRKPGYLVVRNAELAKSGDWIAVDGEVVIDRANVDFIQVLARGVVL